jgi:hypothetical protein
LLRSTLLSSTSSVVVFKVVVSPFTVKSPLIIKLPPTVTLSGKPIVIAPFDADTSISFSVPARDVTTVADPDVIDVTRP